MRVFLTNRRANRNREHHNNRTRVIVDNSTKALHILTYALVTVRFRSWLGGTGRNGPLYRALSGVEFNNEEWTHVLLLFRFRPGGQKEKARREIGAFLHLFGPRRNYGDAAGALTLA